MFASTKYENHAACCAYSTDRETKIEGFISSEYFRITTPPVLRDRYFTNIPAYPVHFSCTMFILIVSYGCHTPAGLHVRVRRRLTAGAPSGFQHVQGGEDGGGREEEPVSLGISGDDFPGAGGRVKGGRRNRGENASVPS
jgi:hypothetical protein